MCGGDVYYRRAYSNAVAAREPIVAAVDDVAVSFERVRRWGKSLVPRQRRGRPLMGPKLISRNCGYTVMCVASVRGYPFYPNRNKISPYMQGGESERALAAT